MLSPTTGYAIFALGWLAGHADEATPVHAIADGCGMPSPYLSKVLHALSKSGLVRSKRGYGGGVTIARPPETIRLLHVCEAMDEPALEHRCVMGLERCRQGHQCAASKFCKTRHAALLDYLRNTTIADISDDALSGVDVATINRAESRPGDQDQVSAAS